MLRIFDVAVQVLIQPYVFARNSFQCCSKINIIFFNIFFAVKTRLACKYFCSVYFYVRPYFKPVFASVILLQPFISFAEFCAINYKYAVVTFFLGPELLTGRYQSELVVFIFIRVCPVSNFPFDGDILFVFEAFCI